MSSVEQGTDILVLPLVNSFLAVKPLQMENGAQWVGKSTAFLFGPANGKVHTEKGLLFKDADVSFFHSLPPNIFICWVIKEGKFCLFSLYLLLAFLPYKSFIY